MPLRELGIPGRRSKFQHVQGFRRWFKALRINEGFKTSVEEVAAAKVEMTEEPEKKLLVMETFLVQMLWTLLVWHQRFGMSHQLS